MSAASHAGSGGSALPAPNVRLIHDPHTEPGNGLTLTFGRRLQVSASDFGEAEDLRIELLRLRKRVSAGRGWQWVHPADHTGQTNTLDGGRTRGGLHTDTNGQPMASRSTSFPVTGEYVWTNVDMGGWWKQGEIDMRSADNNSSTQIQVPVTTGTKSVSAFSSGGPWVPHWACVGGSTTMKVKFRLSAVNPDGEDDRDRLTGPSSTATVVIRPGQNNHESSFPVWPDGFGGAQGQSTTSLHMALESL